MLATGATMDELRQWNSLPSELSTVIPKCASLLVQLAVACSTFQKGEGITCKMTNFKPGFLSYDGSEDLAEIYPTWNGREMQTL